MPLTVETTNEQKILITLNPVTLTGKPAQLDGPAVVEVASGDANVDMVSDRSFYLVSSDTPGPSQFNVSADADLGEGVETIQDVVTYNVVGSNAANLGLTAGTAEPK